jgi:hypothetical protein
LSPRRTAEEPKGAAARVLAFFVVFLVKVIVHIFASAIVAVS